MPNKLIKDLIDKGAVTLKEQGYSIRSSEYTIDMDAISRVLQ